MPRETKILLQACLAILGLYIDQHAEEECRNEKAFIEINLLFLPNTVFYQLYDNQFFQHPVMG